MHSGAPPRYSLGKRTVPGEGGVPGGSFELRNMTNQIVQSGLTRSWSRESGANFGLYKANSSATVHDYEQEIHGPCVCRDCCRMPTTAAGCSLSCCRGRGRGTGACAGQSANRQRPRVAKGSRKSRTADPRDPPPIARTPWILGIARAVTVVGILFSSLFAHADQGGTQTTSESVRFAKLVAAGDLARRLHRNSEALKAYGNALDIRNDPAVEGRMGLVLLDIGYLALAAENLLRAITKAQAPPQLMKQFHDAFARVRPKVCFVEVFVSEQGADVLIDGKQEPVSDYNAWHVFITAGSHTFLAKLDGFEDATKTIDVPAGGELEVRLNLKPIPPPPPVQVAPMPNPDPKPVVPAKPHKSLSDSYLHFLLGAGPVLVLGATPSAAFGPQLTGGVRRWFVSVNVDARVAWALGTSETAPNMKFMTWATTVRPCLHYAFLFGCGLLQVSGMRSLSEEDRWQTRFGGGLHAGVDLLVRAPVHLQLWGEGVVLTKGYSLIKDDKGLWDGLPVLGGFGATAFLTW